MSTQRTPTRHGNITIGASVGTNPATGQMFIDHGVDVLAAYCTLQYYALIHIFARPARDTTVWDSCRLFLKGLGIDVSG